MPRVSVERNADGPGSTVTIGGVGSFSTPLPPEKLPVDGAELSEFDAERLVSALEEAALGFGAKMLGIRLMTRGMFIERMVREGYDEDTASRAADKFEKLGAIDDEEYARLFSESRRLRGWGQIRIRGELRRRGVRDDVKDDVLSGFEDMSGEIERFIEKRTGGVLVDRRQADKIAAALIRRGFKWDEIRPVLDRYTGDEYN